MNLADDLEILPTSQCERRRGPLAHAVHRQYGSALERRGEEGAGGVTKVVLRKNQLALPIGLAEQPFELLEQQAFLEELLFYP